MPIYLLRFSQSIKVVKTIKPEELPKVLDNKTIDILARMAIETPQSREWHDIFDKLNHEQLRWIMYRKSRIQMREYRELWESLSEEEQVEENRKRQEARDNPDRFYGNMGNPEYPGWDDDPRKNILKRTRRIKVRNSRKS